MSTTEAAAPEPKPSQTYEAGCHCGFISFSVTLSPPLPEYKPLECNCSACRRFGYLLVCKSQPGESLPRHKVYTRVPQTGAYTCFYVLC